jgi:hypothetical protein
MGAVRQAVEVNGGDGALVVGGGEGEVGKLLGGVEKLGMGPIGVEKGRRGVLHGEQEAVVGGGRRQRCSGRNWRAAGGWGARAKVGKACYGVGGSNGRSVTAVHGDPWFTEKGKRGGGGEHRSGVGETAEGPGERDVGAFVVLMHAKDKALGFCSGLSPVAARWRPSRAPGGRGACKQGQRREEIGPGQGERDAWRPTKQEVERQRRHSGDGEVLCTGGREGTGAEGCQRKKKGGRGPRGLFGNFKNLRDLSVK